ncbi:Protein transport protein S9 plasma membrane t-SNARE [Saxophila tyrrhenica]|uniref:Protein transport protein S9 plasma membrane t-SNARE n=1 Tax=Saxophila tyrrhenica TaxID=1690608 RepID=A0AAV9PDZ7_9PEZI|nr:Protein transport protein S9 plasma membrane t-SNARE [Saxophila tyrrhenica]
MPFGFKKGEKDADLDSKKASLFGSRSNKSSPAPSSANPYAAAPPPANDPYASRNANPYANQGGMNDPYAPKQQSRPSQPPTSSFGNLSLNNDAPPGYNRGPSPQPNRYEKSPVPPGGYGGAPRYQNSGSYGQTSGYGSDPYGSQQQQQSRYGPSGYGGMGRSNSNDTMSTDAGRNALFGDAANRAAAQPQQPPSQQHGGDNSYSNTGGYGANDLPGGYGSAPDRELTEEEQEEQDVLAAKTEIRFIKQQDVASTRNARRIAEQAEQTGRETLARLGQQGERIHNTERNLDMSSNQNRLAAEKASELKTLNRSMFAVHVSNPFTAKSREQAANAIALEKHQAERAQRDATTAEAYGTQARQQQHQRDVNGNVVRKPAGSKSLAERAKYQFEADSEDEEMENEIDDNLDAIHRGAKTLNALGKAMGTEIESQNKHIDRITTKTDKVDDQIALNRARLDRIR